MEACVRDFVADGGVAGEAARRTAFAEGDFGDFDDFGVDGGGSLAPRMIGVLGAGDSDICRVGMRDGRCGVGVRLREL